MTQGYNTERLPKKAKKGIGGWLLFFTVTIFIYMFSALLSIFQIISTCLTYFGDMDLYWKVLLMFSMFMVVLFFVTSVLVLVQIIRKNTAGIYASILLCYLGIFMQILNLITIKGTSPLDLIYIVIWGAIWIIYFSKSKRVRNTLVNESSGQWVNAIIGAGGTLLTIGYIGAIALHIYTAYLVFKFFGFLGLVISLMLPGISEIYLFIKSITESGTFYNYYSMLLLFYIVVTYGVAIILNSIGSRMEKAAMVYEQAEEKEQSQIKEYSKMNFLDAHRMVHDFASVVGNGCEDEDDYFLSIENLPFPFNKDRIVSAFQIFIYHTVFFHTRTKEQYEQYYVLYQANIGRFLPRSEILKVRQYSKIIGNKNPIYKVFSKQKIKMAGELYGNFMKQNSHGFEPYRIDDIFSTNLGEMQDYRKELAEKIRTANDEEIYDVQARAIELYAKKSYEKANIEWEDEYYYYFQKFESMRNALNKGLYEDYYLKYEDYIFSNQ